MGQGFYLQLLCGQQPIFLVQDFALLWDLEKNIVTNSMILKKMQKLGPKKKNKQGNK
jgi:hypothetical protein